MKRDAETGVILLQPKEHQRFLATYRNKKRQEASSPRAFGGCVAKLTP